MIEFGEIKEVKEVTVVVSFPALDSDIECNMLYPYTTEQQLYYKPKVGESVACHLGARKVCLGAMFNDQDKAPNTEGTIYKSDTTEVIKSSEGVEIKKGDVTVKVSDKVEIKKGNTQFNVSDKIEIKGASTDLKTVLDKIIDQLSGLKTVKGDTISPDAIPQLQLLKQQLSTLLK
ncbi:MAG: hypothetical protein N4A72_14740 [Bacteroidales bacterium]|jgi:hypothetical protein|nr:hypothetical protein [Bacteroidales bacterium]